QMHTHLEPVKVLIAEDGEVNMMLAKIIIKRIAPNAAILEAVNGQEAVELYKNELPDIVFMDIQMPEMNGYEATRMIRQMQTNQRIPIVAITAGTVKGEREKCLAAGMDDFISKPIVENSVFNVFNKWFEVNEKVTEPVKEDKPAQEETPHISFEKLKEIVGDDSEALKGFLALTRQEISRSLSELEDKYHKKDIVALHKSGHKLKGTALSAGLDKLLEIAIKFDKLRVYDETHISGLITEARNETGLILQIIDKSLLN
ncbi:MAG: response regulator, partial [Bacteroidota bacterium]|nr:response regulator [Bacteroidota bacterium]